MADDVTSLKIRIISDEVEAARKRLDALENSSRKAEKGVGTMGAGMLQSMISAAALGVALGSVTRNWLEYDKSMKEVSSIMSSSREEFLQLRENVLALSTAMGVDATVAAKGLYQALSAGIPKENAFKFLATASQAAIAGVTSVEKSVDVLTNVINAYKLPVSQAETISDKLFSAIKDGKTTMEELSQSMSKGSVPAAALGVNLDELLSSVVAITLQGTPTAEAFTQVAATMTALKDPSAEMASAIRGMGYESARAAIAALGYGEVLQKLRKSAGDDDAAFQKLFGRIEASNGVISQSGVNFESYLKAMENSKKSAGLAAAAAEANGSTFQIAAIKMKNAWTGLMETFEDSFGLLNKVGTLIGVISDMMSKPFNGPDLEIIRKGGTQAGIYMQEQIRNLEAHKKRLESLASGRASDEVGGDVAKAFKIHAATEAIEGLKSAYNNLSEAEKSETEHFLKRDALRKSGMSHEEQGAALAKMRLQWNAETAYAEKLRASNALTLEDQKRKDDAVREGVRIQQDAADKESKALEDQKNANEKVRFDKMKGLDDEIARTNKLIELGVKRKGISAEEGAADIARLTEEKLKIMDELAAAAARQQDGGLDGMVLPPKLSQAGQLEDKLKMLELDRQLGIEIEKRGKSEIELKEIQKAKYKVYLENHPKELAGVNAAIAAVDAEIEAIHKAENAKAESAAKDEERKQKAAAAALAKFALNPIFEAPANTEFERLAKEELAIEQSYQRRKADIIALTTATEDEKSALIDQADKQRQAADEYFAKARNAATLNAYSGFFGNIASMQSAFGEKGFKIAQAAAIAQATISMHQGAVSAYASGAAIPVVGAVMGPLFAAGAIAAGAANIASIKSQSYSGAYAEGGMIPSGSYGLVGEAGPEFVRGPAIVTSANASRGLMDRPSGDSKPMSITINNLPGQIVETKQSDDGKQIEFTVQRTIDILTAQAQNGGGKFIPALARSHGLTRKA